MTPTETLDYGLNANHRNVSPRTESGWRRPATARSTSFEQPTERALPDMTFRDATWRHGDRRDLYALAALSIGFAAVAAVLSLYTT